MKEQDLFKKALKSKLENHPIPSEKDEMLWKNIVAELGETKKPAFHYAWVAVAASVVLCLSIGIYFWTQNDSQNRISKSVVATNQVKTDTVANKKPEPEISKPKDQKTDLMKPEKKWLALETTSENREHVLPDGSMIVLRKNASIQIAPNFQQNRQLKLNGEAYFEVVPDQSHPFSVLFGTNKLVVVGTKFNIRNIDAEKTAEVCVAEGIVKVHVDNKQENIRLMKGEWLSIGLDESPKLAKVDPNNFLYWKTGILDFKEAKLATVATLVSRVYECHFTVQSNVANCTFTGDLSKLSLDEAIKIIEISTSLKIEKVSHGFHLSGQGCD